MYRARHNDLNEQIFKKLVSTTYYAVFEVEVNKYKEEYWFFSELIDKVVFMDSTQDSLNNYLREREDHWWKWFDNDDESEMQ